MLMIMVMMIMLVIMIAVFTAWVGYWICRADRRLGLVLPKGDLMGRRASGTLLAIGVLFWVQGDKPGASYNGYLVALGWGFMFVDRKYWIFSRVF
jgi:hypothetical protein